MPRRASQDDGEPRGLLEDWAYSLPSAPPFAASVRRMTAQERLDAGFHRGFAAALAPLARTFGQPAMIRQIMNGAGVSVADLEAAQVDGFDLDPIRDSFIVLPDDVAALLASGKFDQAVTRLAGRYGYGTGPASLAVRKWREARAQS